MGITVQSHPILWCVVMKLILNAFFPAMCKCHAYASVYKSFVFLQGIPATVDGMLGGFSRLSGTDIAASKKFLLPFLQASSCLPTVYLMLQLLNISKLLHVANQLFA